MTLASPPAKKIKVCHVIHRFATGGLENGLVNLINHLPQEKYQHVIVTMQGYDPEFAARLNVEVPIYSLDKKAGKDFGVFVRMFRLLRKLKPDIMHTRNLATLEMNLPGYLSGIRRRIHGEHGWDINDPDGSVKKYQRLRRLVGNFIHLFVALSKEQERYLLERVGIKRDKVTRICNGVDLSRFSNVKQKSNQEINEDKLVIGCVGRLAPIKGHSVLLRAFKNLLQNVSPQIDNLELQIAGEGDELSRLSALAEQLDIGDKVKFLGNQSDIPAVLAGFDLFVLPSHAEGISNTILEAMAAGLPVVATRVGGNADLIAEGETGVIVDVNSPEALAKGMLSIVNDKNLRDQLGQKAQLRAQTEFSLEVMVNRYDGLYCAGR